MALNTLTFKTRTITAIVFVIIMLAGLLINEWTFFALFSIIHFGCWFEYQKLISKIDARYKHKNLIHKFAAPLAGWAFMWWMFDFSFYKNFIQLHEIFFWIMIAALVIVIFSQLLFDIKNLGYSLFGLIYISLSWGLMISMRTEKNNHLFSDASLIIPLILIGSLWINDTMAYVVGSLIGNTSLSKISPKKTWEGTIGGALLAVVTVTLVGYFFLDITDIFFLIAISSIAVVTGTCGDLFESKLKRMANVKDSGNIMPGHGGFLDRFDSLLLSTPFVFLYTHFFL